MSFDETLDGTLRPGERQMICRVLSARGDALVMDEYADWLTAQGDARGGFVRQFARTLSTGSHNAFPKLVGEDEHWLEFIGYRLADRIAERGLWHFAHLVFGVARPALRMQTSPQSDEELEVGCSKFGGNPDLPADFVWPIGDQCRATYNDDTAGEQRLAGFLGQIDLDELRNAVTNDRLPLHGMLSFWGFQDLENDNPDKIGVMACWFPDRTILARREPPSNLSHGNQCFAAARITFTEFLDLPSGSGPWSDDLSPLIEADEEAFHFGTWDNIQNVLGYAVGTSADDPTPDKSSHHLIFIPGCELSGGLWPNLHIQIDVLDLAHRRFENIRLVWVDWD